MDTIGIIRWIAIGLHGIVLVFSLSVIFALTGGDIAASFVISEKDAALRQAMSLAVLVIGGNAVGVILLLTPLFRSFIGSCVLVGYEVAFLITSFIFLSFDYSLVIGVVTCALLYVANVRWKVRAEM